MGMMRGGGWVSFWEAWFGDVCVGEEWVVVWGCWFGFLAGGWLDGWAGHAFQCMFSDAVTSDLFACGDTCL